MPFVLPNAPPLFSVVVVVFVFFVVFVVVDIFVVDAVVFVFKSVPFLSLPPSSSLR